MKRRTRWLLAAALLLPALPVAAVAAAVALIDPDDHKARLSIAVERATGRALELRGPLRVAWALWPTVEASDVRFGNLPGGSRPDMARVERIAARLSLTALLHRRLDVAELTLIGPNILFELVDGRPNWVLEPPPDADPGPAADSPPGNPVSVEVRRARVVNGMVTLRLPQRTHVVGLRTLDWRHRAAGAPLEMDGVLVYADNQPFGLRVSATPTGNVRDPWDAEWSLSAFEASIRARGRMTLDGRYDLRLEAEAPALERLNALLPELALPALRGLRARSHLRSGREPGDLPVIGEAALSFDGAGADPRWPGLLLGPVRATLPAAGGRATATGSGRYAGRALDFEAGLEVPERLDGRIEPAALLRLRDAGSAAGPGSGSAAERNEAALRGRLALDRGAFAGLDAALTLRLPDPPAWRAVLPASVLLLRDVALSGQLTLPADLGNASLRGAALRSREAEAAGDLAVGLGEATALRGRLRTLRLDLDALLGAADASGDGALFSAAPLPWEQLRGTTLDLAAAAVAARWGGRDWRGADLAATLSGGRLRLTRLQLLPGAAGADRAGALSLTLDADAARPIPSASLTLDAPALPLSLLGELAGLPEGAARGPLRLEARLSASGESPRALAASLEGTLSASLLDGSLGNAVLRALAGPALAEMGIAVPAEGRSALRCLGLIGAFQDGVGRFPAILLDSAPLQLEGAGQVNLRDETLALQLRPLVPLAGARVAAPVVVEGPIRAPQGRLDATGLDQVGLLLNALLGGDRPRGCAEAGLAPAVR